MKSDILSLKSIYQFLTINDYPVYSAGIITRKNHAGLTLTKFWRENILLDFRNRKCGKQIWRNDGGRNRYISDICNRSARMSLYGEYAEEILDAADPETVLRQIQQFMDVLLTRDYSYGTFCQKLPCYLELIAEWDRYFSSEARLFFESAMEKREKFEKYGNNGRAFFCGWFLTVLMFHALAGNGEGDSAMSRLRQDSSLQIENLGRTYLKKEKPRGKAVFLTGRNTELCSSPLPRQHFFGREKEMFELRRMVIHGGKYLVSGMGGIGKTELMRQLLKCCEEETLADYICTIQYEGSLSASFVKAFPQIRGANMEENFYEALACVRMHEKDSVLILIDNMDQNRNEELAILASLPATVFVTSRYQEFKGFTTYSVSMPGRSAARLIFQDNYDKAMGPEDDRILTDILEQDIWRHTLTLRLLGRAAADRGWTLPQLQERLNRGIMPVSMQKRDMYGDLQQMYRRIYADSKLKKEKKGLLRIFSVLPHQNYTPEFAERFLQGFLTPGYDMRKALKRLHETGWLEEHESGYSMHPFIAECVRSGGVKESEITPFLESLADAWERSGRGFRIENVLSMALEWEGSWKDFDAGLMESTALVPNLCLNLTGKCSSLLSELALLAYEIQFNNFGPSAEELERLVQVKEKSDLRGVRARAVLCILLCNYNYSELDQLKGEYRFLESSQELKAEEKAMLANQLAMAYYNGKNLEGTEEMLDELKKYEGEKYVHVLVCHLQALIAVQRGDVAALGEWLIKGYEVGKKEGWRESRIMQETLFHLVSYYVGIKEFAKAERILDEAEICVRQSGGMLAHCECLFSRGSLAAHRGDEGFGIEQLEEACKQARNFWFNVLNGEYAICVEELALAYNKAGRREEALERYTEALDIFRQQPGQEFDRLKILNNMSVMYLDWGKPEEALSYLEEALVIAEKMGGLGLAETQNNLSRAWNQQGDRKKELQYLRKAAPVLEQFYGDEHPKVTDAKRRLGEYNRDIEEQCLDVPHPNTH